MRSVPISSVEYSDGIIFLRGKGSKEADEANFIVDLGNYESAIRYAYGKGRLP